MPRVSINREKYMKTDLTEFIVGKMYKRFTQAEMGELLGITQQAFGKKLKTANFTFSELVKIFEKLGASSEDIVRLLTK